MSIYLRVDDILEVLLLYLLESHLHPGAIENTPSSGYTPHSLISGFLDFSQGFAPIPLETLLVLYLPPRYQLHAH